MTEMLKKIRRAFYDHKYDATKRRGIPFELTFDEWFKIWTDSGHLQQRGHKKGQYVMARFGDKGPYAPGNVKIITCSENISEAQIGQPKSKTTRQKMSKPKTPEHKAKIKAWISVPENRQARLTQLNKIQQAGRLLTNDQEIEIRRLYVRGSKEFCLRALSIRFNVKLNVIWLALQRGRN